MVDKNKSVVCSLLATSAIMLSEKKKRKRKIWIKKWYLKRNIQGGPKVGIQYIVYSLYLIIIINYINNYCIPTFGPPVSCDAHLLNELLETDVPWDDAIVVSAGKLRKLWDSLSELCSFLCERRLENTVLKPALLPVKTAQFTQFFRQVWRYTEKSLSLTESV
jgi:hypothetical protein